MARHRPRRKKLYTKLEKAPCSQVHPPLELVYDGFRARGLLLPTFGVSIFFAGRLGIFYAQT